MAHGSDSFCRVFIDIARTRNLNGMPLGEGLKLLLTKKWPKSMMPTYLWIGEMVHFQNDMIFRSMINGKRLIIGQIYSVGTVTFTWN